MEAIKFLIIILIMAIAVIYEKKKKAASNSENKKKKKPAANQPMYPHQQRTVRRRMPSMQKPDFTNFEQLMQEASRDMKPKKEAVPKPKKNVKVYKNKKQKSANKPVTPAQTTEKKDRIRFRTREDVRRAFIYSEIFQRKY